MVCSHLHKLEEELIASGVAENYRGQAWSENCREWVYFDVVLDIESLMERFDFGPNVGVHQNLDPKSGTERGFVCNKCHDAIMGFVVGGPTFR